jgi:hypothetical protein
MSCVDLTTEIAHCGMCDRACMARPNTSMSCREGSCEYSCESGFGDCDSDDANGCEQSLDTLMHCGMCGRSCGANASCSAGSCTCNTGYGDCNMSLADGCETDLTTDVAHCGMCGRSCGANASCSAGSCTCASGYGDCNMSLADGCETPLDTLMNCGACGMSCSRANATATCSTGTCQIASCNMGYDNCDGDDSNGCETNLNTDPNNCGMCGNSCPMGQTCSGGMCQP